jgi:hypothetical protein
LQAAATALLSEVNTAISSSSSSSDTDVSLPETPAVTALLDACRAAAQSVLQPPSTDMSVLAVDTISTDNADSVPPEAQEIGVSQDTPQGDLVSDDTSTAAATVAQADTVAPTDSTDEQTAADARPTETPVTAADDSYESSDLLEQQMSQQQNPPKQLQDAVLVQIQLRYIHRLRCVLGALTRAVQACRGSRSCVAHVWIYVCILQS